MDVVVITEVRSGPVTVAVTAVVVGGEVTVVVTIPPPPLVKIPP